MMNKRLKSMVGVMVACAVSAASAQVVLFEREGFSGRTLTAERSIGNLQRVGFNDRASSAVVRGGIWEVCEDARYTGHCVRLRPGSYGSLFAMGLDNRVSSLRPVRAGPHERGFYSPSGYDYRRRRNERIYEADVLSVRAVVETPQRRCWIEQQHVVTRHQELNVPGAIIGGLLGGVLGHQIGGGRGQDLATGIGAIGGAVAGAQVGRPGRDEVTTQDVKRCASAPPSARPDYYDVSYIFRGQEHRVQLTAPPGPTIPVNAKGEPRI